MEAIFKQPKGKRITLDELAAMMARAFSAMQAQIDQLPTKEDVRNQVEEALKPFAKKSDLNPYATKDDVKNEIREALRPYATKDDVRQIVRQEIRPLVDRVDRLEDRVIYSEA